MDYKEAIEILQTLYPFKCKMVDGRLKGGFRDYECDKGKSITFAISSMQELQMYKAGKLVLIPDAVHKKQCEELDEYKKLGTLEISIHAPARGATNSLELFHGKI